MSVQRTHMTGTLLYGLRGRRWRSAEVGPDAVRVVAVNRSDLPETRRTAARILGGPAFAALSESIGTVFGLVEDLPRATNWTVTDTVHAGCPECYSVIFRAIDTLASQGKRRGTVQSVRRVLEGDPHVHGVTMAWSAS